jgi:2',3'-cyclic-nucleotide 2'-phosphodiesterase (5'-nucleotidase family)
MKTAVLWHTNDIHSSFDHFASISTILKLQRNPVCDLTLDAGDFCDLRSIMISGTNGTGGIALLQAAGYDAMAVGNNEFFTGVSVMEEMCAMGFPLLSCNLSALDGSLIKGIQPYLILKRNGVRYLIIGVCPYWGEVEDGTAFTDMAGITLLSPYERIQHIIDSEHGHYDVSILLSHAGYHSGTELTGDRLIADRVHGIDIIIGGHSHVLMEHAVKEGSTWIHQSGSHGTVLGKVTMTLDDQNHLVDVTADNIPSNAEENPQILAVLDAETARGRKNLEQPLYELSSSLDYDAYHECSAVNAVADSLHQEYGGDLGLINHGILSGGLSGTISRMSLLEAEPSPLNPTTVIWTGAQIAEALQASFDETVMSQCNHRWNGFRGTVLGALAVSWNVSVIKEPFHVTIDGIPLDPMKYYTVITDDFLQRGSGYEMLGCSKGVVEFHPKYIRDLLQWTLNSPALIQRAYRKRIN